MAKEIAEEYASSLADLTVNSKPLINMLTILAEENVEHAGVIVDTVEKHLEKVNPDIKLPVLYLVDSIIKNVGGAYTQKFAQSIVNMFTKTFKQVDEKVRSQMFKLRETWHDVFPATKLYQLDVKVNLIDPAWPIQAQPPPTQSIHVNPNFLKKPATTAPPTTLTPDEEKMRSLLAKKEQELLMLQRKKIEMELEQTRRQLEMAEKSAKKVPQVATPAPASMGTPAVVPGPVPPIPEVSSLPARARLGPPVPKSTGRIAPVSGALAAARRDPRLARHNAHAHMQHSHNLNVPNPNQMPIAPNVFDIKPLERVTKRKNVITIDVRPETEVRPERVKRDPRLSKREDRPRREKERQIERRRKLDEDRRKEEEREKKRERDEMKEKKVENDANSNTVDEYINKLSIADPKRINKLPPIPKLNRDAEREPIPKFHRDSEREPVPKLNRDRDAEREPIPKFNRDSEREPIPKFNRDSEREPIPKFNRDSEREPIPKLNRDSEKDPSPKVSRDPEKDLIPKLNREPEKDKDSPKKRKEPRVSKKKRDSDGKDSSSGSSPDKKKKELKKKAKVAAENVENDVVAFKELKNYHKERYMRRNKEKSESPTVEKLEQDAPEEPTSSTELLETKDVDLRVLPAAVQKRPSTETVEGKAKKSKLDKFDILFGNEDVDLRQLPQVEEVPPPPPSISSPKPESPTPELAEPFSDVSPPQSPKKDWHEVKEKDQGQREEAKKPSKLDLVRAKLAEATKGKDRLGRPLLFSKSPNVERERRRTISAEDVDLRTEVPNEFDAEDHKKTISIIMNQAKEQFTDGQIDNNQYKTLMYQVLQLNEKLKLKEAKQRESLEISKKKLKAHIEEQNHKVLSPKSSPNSHNTFGDIDERIVPSFVETRSDSQGFMQDSDMRMVNDGPRPTLLQPPMPMYMPYWRGPRPRMEEFGPRRFRGPAPPYFRGKFDKRSPRFDSRMPMPLPTPKLGMVQGESPLRPYVYKEAPPPLGSSVFIPPTDMRVLDYIDQDPVKTIQIDGVPREIRFYGDTAIIMLDWDDPREIKFLPGCRRITFDNKDSVVLSFNEPFKQVEIDDQVFDIRYGAPTRELYINGEWFECFFGGQPFGVVIDGKPRLVHLEGPLPQVDIGKTKRTDLVAGKINLIVNATQMCPVYLDAKVQKVLIDGQYYTLRFVDSLKTILINEQPFKVDYGDLPKPITLGNDKFFIRFSALPKNIKPGQIQIANMEGLGVTPLPQPQIPFEDIRSVMEVDERPPKTPSPDHEHQGLDMLASVMPSSTEEAPPSASEYSLAEPLFTKSDKIPGLETSPDEKPAALPILGNINVSDLFAKLVATGIVANVSNEAKKEGEASEAPKVVPVQPKEDKTKVHRVDMLKPHTLRVKQPGLVAALYGGMQCSGCGARFPPEHTVRYSQHLDWHFRQNRRERDSARRAHSRHWHYDLSDWVQYEEIEDLEEREKSWFETGGEAASPAAGGPACAPDPAPSVACGEPLAHQCALCGDTFDQFYNEDKEEWHLRNSVRHEDKNYHPMCFEDYKASLTKEEPPKSPSDDVVSLDKDDAISVREDDDDANESDVELITENNEPLEIEEDGEEDDVVLKAEPVVQVSVDDGDTDDETSEARAERDKLAAIHLATVKIKQEPIDPDDEPIITAEEEKMKPNIDNTQTAVLSSIDGNVQLESTPATTTNIPFGGIRINISKSIPTFISTEDRIEDTVSLEDISVDEPLPPGEEPELEYKLKPSLEGKELSRQPPVRKGTELSGLCSIM